MVEMLNQAPGLPLSQAGGRVLRLPFLRRRHRQDHAQGKKIATDDDFVTYLLEAEVGGGRPGSAFGLSLPHFRISHATSSEALKPSLHPDHRACEALK